MTSNNNMQLLATAQIKDSESSIYTASVYKEFGGGFRLALTSNTGGLSEVAFNAPAQDKIAAMLDEQEKDRQHRAKNAPI